MKIEEFFPPLDLLSFSAFLELHDYSHYLFDSTFSTVLEQRSFLVKEQPDILFLQASSNSRAAAISIIKFVKSSPSLVHCKVIVFGPDVTFQQRNYLDQGADFTLFASFQNNLIALLKQLQNGGEGLESICGISYLGSKGELIQHPKKEENEYSNEPAIPTRAKIDLQPYIDYWFTHHKESIVIMNAAQSCSCYQTAPNNTLNARGAGRRNASLVVKEMLKLKSTYHFEKIYFVDDVFTADFQWLKEFAEEIHLRNEIIPFTLKTNAEKLNEELIQILKNVGCYRIWMIADCKSQKINDTKKGSLTMKEVRDMVKLIHNNGIETGLTLRLGYPGERERDIKASLQQLLKANPDYLRIELVYPSKGSALFEEVKNLINSKLDWAKSSDAMLDFKRRYTRKYYDYAIQWMYDEIAFHKATKLPFKLNVLKHLFTAWTSYARMLYQRINPAHWM